MVSLDIPGSFFGGNMIHFKKKSEMSKEEQRRSIVWIWSEPNPVLTVPKDTHKELVELFGENVYKENNGSFINPGDYDDKMNILFTHRTASTIKRTFIEKKVVIKKIFGLEFGVEFTSTHLSDPSHKALGFYMMG